MGFRVRYSEKDLSYLSCLSLLIDLVALNECESWCFTQPRPVIVKYFCILIGSYLRSIGGQMHR